MKVAVLREMRPGETRVALVPGTLSRMMKAGFEIAVESDAGTAAGYLDEEYVAAGATVGDVPSVLEGAGVVVKIQPPLLGEDGARDEVALLPSGAVLVSLLYPVTNLDIVKRLADANLTALAMDAIPRITRAQTMDVLSSQATVAGYKAVLLGADTLGKFLPMFTTAAGTIPPGKVLILGAGVAGLQAIATARRLGAVVSAFDVRPAVKEQVQSLGAKFLETELVGAEDEGGYAQALSEDQHQRELDLLAEHVPQNDLVVTTAQIPGKPAPLLITEETVGMMQPGSVIVDLAAETGGNCALTKAGETVVHKGVTILGPVNLPASLPLHASQMYSRNVQALLLDMVKDGTFSVDMGNDVVDGACIVHEGTVRHQPTKEALGFQ